MTLKQLLFDGADGTVLDNTNGPSYGLSLVNAVGGTVKLSAAAANNGATGLAITGPAGGAFTVVRAKLNADSTKVGMSVVFAIPSLPSTASSFMAICPPTGGAMFTVAVDPDGSLHVNVDGSSTGATPKITAGSLYRLEVVLDTTAGTLTWKLFPAKSDTAIATGTGTSLTFPSGMADYWQGGTLQSTPGWQLYFDDVQLDDGATTAPPKISAQAASTVRPNGVTLGDFTVVGAADGAVALADNDDSTYVESPTAAAGDAFTDDYPPLSEGTVTVKKRLSKSTGDATVTAQVELLQGSTVVASQTFTVTTTPTDYQFTTTSAEAANISDYTDLHSRVTATVS